MKNLYYSTDISKIDKISQEDYKQPGIILMEQAGLKAWLNIKSNLSLEDNIVIVSGGGNNGGDSLVIARCAFNDGFKNINIIYCSKNFSQSTLIQKNILDCYDIPKFNYLEKEVKSVINNATVIIDGITAIGLKDKLRDDYINIVNIINASKATVYSVDVPSGLSDTINDVCIKADYTLCMGPLKILYYFHKNIDYCNNIIEINPSFPPQVIEKISPIGKLENELDIKIQPLKKCDYKKTRGHLAIFGGSNKYSGAIRLAAKAAFHSRCGLVSAFCDEDIFDIVAKDSPSIIVNKIRDDLNLLNYDAILAGPGWSSNRENLLLNILSFNKPTIIDADGIRAYSSLFEQGKINVKNNDKLIFTPHLGELKVLANAVLKDYSIDNTIDFINTLTKLSNSLNSVIVCKASVTYLFSPNSIVKVFYHPNPSLGVAGSGDVLAGCIASCLAYGLSIEESAKEGVVIHMKAGKESKERYGFYDSEQLIFAIGEILK